MVKEMERDDPLSSLIAGINKDGRVIKNAPRNDVNPHVRPSTKALIIHKNTI